MNLFYAEPSGIQPPVIELTGSEADHALKVLRYREGDEIHITDGRGSHFTCEVTGTSKSRLSAEIRQEEKESRKKPAITILMGLIRKRDRLEFAVEKCVELGADQIRIFRGDHSEKQNVRTDRIEATILSAMKQSLRFYKPGFTLFSDLDEAIENAGSGRLIVADETTSPGGEIQGIEKKDLILVVGPEGGFSQQERLLLGKAGAVSYSLGKKRLRTETAAAIMVDRFRS
jgi:16S rRNA (uracil1498-N3)-methyltransferase